MSGLLYAINKQGRLVHIDDVPNGLSCDCRCPACGEILVAKNNGETKQSHFAHYYGAECAGAHETELHLLAKKILAEEKSLMLPSYGNVYAGGQQHFDRVEVEQTDKMLNLTPDVCAIARGKNGMESRLWIEIKVNHAIGFEKRKSICDNAISCVEIDLARFKDCMVTKEELKSFLLHSAQDREWTNNPVLQAKQESMAKKKREMAMKLNDYPKFVSEDDDDETRENIIYARNNYLASHEDHCLVPFSQCYTCKHHSVRDRINDEISRRHLPVWLKDALSCNLLWLAKAEVISFDKCYCIRYHDYSRFLPTESVDPFGMAVSEKDIRQNKQIIPFLLNTVPDIIAAETLRCKHNMCSQPSLNAKYDIACNFPNVVNKYRKKRKK